MIHDGRERRAGGVILAAGRSSRMGRAKALLPVGTETFVERLVRVLTSAGAAPVVVVAAPTGRRELADRVGGRAVVVVNDDPDRGQLSSLQTGLAALPASSAALITPVDVPLISVHTVQALLHAWRERGGDVVRPVRAGMRGHPVLASPLAVAALLAAGHAGTARTVLRAFDATAIDVEIDEEGPFIDVDTPEDLDAVRRRGPSR